MANKERLTKGTRQLSDKYLVTSEYSITHSRSQESQKLAVTTWSPDSLRTALLQTESLFYCNLNSISIFQAVLERLLPQAGMLTVMVNTLSDARVFLGNRLLSHLLLSQRWGTQDFQANVNLQKLCKCLRPSTQGYPVSKVCFCRHIGFRTAAVICGVHAIVFFFFLLGLLGRAEAGGAWLAVPGGQPTRLFPAAE